MKKLLVLLAFPVMAHAQSWTMSDAQVRDVYVSKQKRVPTQSQVCDQVQVPVYREAGTPNGSAVILGAIIGNAIGRAAGVDGGQTAGTVIGGIAGAEISKNNQQIDHYETREQCRIVTNYRTENNWEYNHSVIKFEHEGRVYQLKFTK